MASYFAGLKWRMKLGSWAQGAWGVSCLFLIAFFESMVLLFPVDLLIIALVPLSRLSWYQIAWIATVASVLGGWLGWGLGRWFWNSWGVEWMEKIASDAWVWHAGRYDIKLPSYLSSYFGQWLGGEHLFEVYDHLSGWIVLLFAFSPLPYKLVAVTAGAAQTDPGIFLLASFLGRGLRFFGVAFLVQCYAERARELFSRWMILLSILFVLGLLLSLAAPWI